jgi:superfamily II DNA or RNA helicase
MTKSEIQEQALKAILMHDRSGVHMTMGTGKTMLGLKYLRKVKGKALVVVPKTALKHSWQEELNNHKFSDLDIEFTTYRSVLRHDPKEYSCIIFDEAHNLKLSHKDFTDNIAGKVLGLTGTPPKFKKGEKYQMMHEVYPIRYVYDLNKAIEDKLLNQVNIHLWGIELSSERNLDTMSGKKTSEVNMYSFLSNKISSLEYEIDTYQRMGDSKTIGMIYQDLKRLRITRLSKIKQFKSKDILLRQVINSIPEDEKVLVFTSTQEQCSRMFRNFHTSFNSPSVNRQIMDKFKSGEIRILGAIEQISEGINIPNLKNVVITHSYASEHKPLQKIGRALRLSTDQIATVHILYYKGTIDEEWVKEGLKSIDSSRITYRN